MLRYAPHAQLSFSVMFHERRSMKFPLIISLSLLFVASCAVWPDPYHMQIYKPVGQNSHSVGSDKLEISIQSSSTYSDEAYPPYRLSLTLLSGAQKPESVKINSVSVSWNNRPMQQVSLTDTYSQRKIHIPGNIENLNPAPCCRFHAISNWLPIGHNPGDTVSVTVGITSSNGQQYSPHTVNVNFEAVTKKGLLQVDGFTG